ncbi:hypothetical protein C0W96_07190 [Photobacterium kishitanii]|uniref:DUF2975 domain-containing protein n=1 Tax=Photobacterium kishitanii TaxID=318456 RepID=A0AAX0YYE6_9GAMM|nr:hypothetical protein C0W96_07190 [Photobacterium kishitanii]PSX20719.1 hypothetical protein C0W70_00325 [Photobacterium kishitanii]PSX28172.1 hypothetical protein C0W52_09425 [Photobacterium kishitanii]PSX34934.1 hypothetical protein C0W39_00325 [Photobacterium kishitanii]PSX45169.1 hypothetical protein C0W53_07995 [Photobacterium kishitanii]
MNLHKITRGLVYYPILIIIFFGAIQAVRFSIPIFSNASIYSPLVITFSLGYVALWLLVSYMLGRILFFEAKRDDKLFTVNRKSLTPIFWASLLFGMAVINVIVLSAFSSSLSLSALDLVSMRNMSLGYGFLAFLFMFIFLLVVMQMIRVITKKVSQ